MTGDKPETGRDQIHKDAKGQFVGTQTDGESDGVASAKPTVVTGSEDATVNKWPPGTKHAPKDWDANFDIRDKPTDG